MAKKSSKSKQAAAKRGNAKAAQRPAKKRVQAVPAGTHTVTPYLTVGDSVAAIAFYQRAFGAKERVRLATPTGGTMHAEIKIGDSHVFLSDEFPGADTRAPSSLGGTAVGLHLSFRNVDAAFQRAVDAGATVHLPLTNMFWGDRFGKVADPFGHVWSMSQHVEDVSPKELMKRAAAAFPPPSAA